MRVDDHVRPRFVVRARHESWLLWLVCARDNEEVPLRRREQERPSWLKADSGLVLDVPRLPYLERQAVLVVSAEEARDSRRALVSAAEGRSFASLEALAIGAARNSGWMGVQMASVRVDRVISPLSLVIPSLLAPAALSAYRAWSRARVSALVISTAEATGLRWPKGDPTKYELYIGSPADPRTYYPAASFHEDVLFERYGELRELLSRLGASRIEAKVTRGRGMDGSVNAQVPLPDAVGSLKASAAVHKASASAREDLRELAPSEPLPAAEIAAGLHWYDREVDWQRLAVLCSLGRAKRERLFLRQGSDYGLNANFEAAVKSLPISVSLGGQYSRYVETVWEVEALFGTAPFEDD